MPAQLIVAFVVVSFGGGVLDRPVHAFDLTFPLENIPPDCFLILGTPRVARLRQTMFDPVGFAEL